MELYQGSDAISGNIYEHVKVIKKLAVELAPENKISQYWLHLISDGLGMPIYVPIIIAKGNEEGPVVGLTAAIHGNELNGIPVIQRLFKEIDPLKLKGTLVGVPVLNVPGLHRKRRRFNDNVDLNHIMPGKANGNVSEVYAYRIVDRIAQYFDYLIDLHTASFGRINSYYIRADMSDDITAQMAKLQNAQIIVHNPPSDGTLRGAVNELGIKAITLEVGDPNKFQKGMIRSGLTGIHNFLSHLGMVEEDIDPPESPTTLCQSSYWLYSDRGGILRVYPGLTDLVKKGDKIAEIQTIFGNVIKSYYAPEDGIVIGKSIDPIAQSGSRILHLGLLK